MTDHDDTVPEDVTWHVDDDGTEWFVDDGVRYELADDGYAYPTADAEDGDIAEDATEEMPTLAADLAERTGAEPDDAAPFSRAAADRGASRGPDGVVVLTIGDRGDRAGEHGAAKAGAPHSAGRTTSTDGHDPLVRLNGVRSGYGQLPVLHGVDLEIRAGETVVLFGLNGAGKTTTARNICGSLKTWGGTIDYDGVDVAGWSTRRCVNAGIVMVPEGRRVFPDLSVARNLQIGAWSQRKDTDWVDGQRERVFDYFPRLRERTGQLAGTLSGGEQQMLALARGLMAHPRLLIVDEASMGLAPVIVRDVFEIVRQINADGVTVLLIEQNVSALEVADVAVVMEQGRIVRELRGEELTDTDAVSHAVMG